MKNFCLTIASGFLLMTSIHAVSWAQESPGASAEGKVNGVKITINYYSPKVKERTIWGGLVPYDEVWRTGANNATTLEVSDNCMIGKNKIPKGKYALFTIPKIGDTWTVILNKEADQWGAFNYKESEDLVRFDVKVERTLEHNESMKFDVTEDGTVAFAWEYKSFKFKIKK